MLPALISFLLCKNGFPASWLFLELAFSSGYLHTWGHCSSFCLSQFLKNANTYISHLFFLRTPLCSAQFLASEALLGSGSLHSLRGANDFFDEKQSPE